jgi:hypothetical protein
MLGRIKKKFLRMFEVQENILISSEKTRSILIEQFLHEHLFNGPKYADPLRLNRYERQVFSQYGEDGILEEIFRRIGVTNRYFIEFGVENGLECNSLFLLLKNWSGLWIEGSPAHHRQITERFRSQIAEGRLMTINAFIKSDNIEQLFKQGAAPAEPDLLSIDIDGNDYHIWKTISNYRPRVLVMEYNAVFPPGTGFVMKYNAEHIWDGTSYYGASLSSLEALCTDKGYQLVGCNFSGVNAFFVRNDLVADLFQKPFTAENHYEPARHFLYRKEGHPRGYGETS